MSATKSARSIPEAGDGKAGRIIYLLVVSLLLLTGNEICFHSSTHTHTHTHTHIYTHTHTHTHTLTHYEIMYHLNNEV